MMLVRSATADITPREPCELAGFRDRVGVFTGIADRLEANACCISGPGHDALIVTLDTLYVGAELTAHIRKEATQTLGVPGSNVLVCASHTHFAPALDARKPTLGHIQSEYAEMVRHRTSEMLRTLASARPKPARVKSAVTPTDRAVNRRRYWPYPVLTSSGVKFGAVVMAPSPKGFCENLVRSLWMYGEDGELLALLWNYACHPVCFPHYTMVSAEFPGVVREGLRKRRSASMPVLFLQGFAGDIRPNVPNSDTSLIALRRLFLGPTFGRFEPAQWKDWAEGISAAVVTAMEAATEVDLTAIDVRHVSMAVGEFCSGEYIPERIDFHKITLGVGTRLLSVSAEPVAEFRALVPNDVILVGCEGDVFGYLPTDAIVAEGGYEGGAFISRFGLKGEFSGSTDACFKRAVQICGIIEPEPLTP